MEKIPIENHITTTRTARFFTIGELNKSTKDIWILIHGHRQLAGDFIAGFEELSGSGSFLIAPEGLMRLYVKGDSGLLVFFVYAVIRFINAYFRK